MKVTYDVSINEVVYVRLTQAGFDHYQKCLGIGNAKRYRADEWYKFRIWALMHIFGSEMRVGEPDCMFIDGNIRFQP